MISSELMSCGKRESVEKKFAGTISGMSDDQLFAAIPVMAHSINGRGEVVAVSPCWLEKLGFIRDEVIGHQITEFFTADSISRMKSDSLPKVFNGITVKDFPLQMTAKCGRHFDVLLSSAPVINEDGEFERTLTFCVDVSEGNEIARRVDFMTRHDSLTSLSTRKVLFESIDGAIETAKTGGPMPAILLLDVDDFSWVNETFGHQAGDDLLASIAARLKDFCGESTVSRHGGDEFLVLSTASKNEQELVILSQKVLDCVAQPYRVDEHEITVSFSVGVSRFPDHGTHSDELLRHANIAMHQSKREGKNRFSIFSTEFEHAAIQRYSRELELRRAIDMRQIYVVYQPKISSKSGLLTGTEALVRWKHPNGKIVPPSEFIPLAEETGLILPLGEFVLRQACQQNRFWQDVGYPPITIAVNISAVQLADKNLISIVQSALSESGLAPEFLQLEITETTAMRDAETTLDILRELKAIGVRIAIDDFGIGYSSLSYLRRFPIDTLKIDRVFVTDIAQDDDRAIVSTIIGLAKAMRMTTVAEGVETAEQRNCLLALGCDEMQGYLFAKPASPADTEAYMFSVFNLLQNAA